LESIVLEVNVLDNKENKTKSYIGMRVSVSQAKKLGFEYDEEQASIRMFFNIPEEIWSKMSRPGMSNKAGFNSYVVTIYLKNGKICEIKKEGDFTLGGGQGYSRNVMRFPDYINKQYIKVMEELLSAG
jgi:hypothetical protein